MTRPNSEPVHLEAVAADGLAQLVVQLSSAQTLSDVMAIVKRAARRLTGADGVTFVLRDGDKCHYADEDAISPLWKGQRFPLSKCVSGWSMLNRQPAVIADIYADSRIPLDAYRLTFVRSLVMVPVRAEDPVAAIGAYWSTRHAPPPAQVTLLEAIAQATAQALTALCLLPPPRRQRPAGRVARR